MLSTFPVDPSVNCPYCGSKLHGKRWHSEHKDEFHYKTHICNCGKHIRVKVDFLGSGHDDWNKPSIEDKIISEKKN